jgi:hypothetical protein
MSGGIARKGFLLRAGLITAGIFLKGCAGKVSGRPDRYKHITGGLKGPDQKAGHMLRDKVSLANPVYQRKVKTLIIGGGISGLSAARWLKKEGYQDFELFELEGHIGGNAHAGGNRFSAYPRGAHYITIANNEDELLIEFFKEQGIITHFENGLPFYNEYYLCFDPEERLLINGQWQEGLIPKFGISAIDQEQIDLFFKLMEKLKREKGHDGKYAFNIPVNDASADEKYRSLDKLSFKSYLTKEGFTSEYLLWYLNYCCKDDYGQKIEQVSAWAGLNYFAGHKGTSANSDAGAVLTWPEGNAFLVGLLRKGLEKQIKTSAMICGLTINKEGKVEVSILDLVKNHVYMVLAENTILAAPQFVNKRLLGQERRDRFNYDAINYAPWAVANITIENFSSSGLQDFSWDNVPYGMPSVGYVYAGHQQTKREDNARVITFYLPLCDREPRISRLAAYARNYEQWLDIIIPELEYMHPGITSMIAAVEVWVWGHGMVVPAVNYIWGPERQKAQQPVDNKIFFAHTDLSGISLFEEGFHQGIRAAKSILKEVE